MSSDPDQSGDIYRTAALIAAAFVVVALYKWLAG